MNRSWSHRVRAGAVAEKDASYGVPWDETEIKERVWALEQRDDNLQGQLLLVYAAVAVVGAFAFGSMALTAARAR